MGVWVRTVGALRRVCVCVLCVVVTSLFTLETEVDQ
jgi:hypothetical protein